MGLLTLLSREIIASLFGQTGRVPVLETAKSPHTCSGIFEIPRYTRLIRHPVDIGVFAEKEVIQ
jgi:hypothetical protein